MIKANRNKWKCSRATKKSLCMTRYTFITKHVQADTLLHATNTNKTLFPLSLSLSVSLNVSLIHYNLVPSLSSLSHQFTFSRSLSLLPTHPISCCIDITLQLPLPPHSLTISPSLSLFLSPPLPLSLSLLHLSRTHSLNMTLVPSES